MPRRKNQGQDENADETTTTGEERDYTVRAVERVCSILNLLQNSIDGVSLIEVGQATELPKSSAFRYLWTLEAHRYVERDEHTGLYRLGLGFVGMQSRHLEVLRERARPWLEELRDEFEETTNLGILDGDHVIYVDIVESRHKVRSAAARGERDPLHSTALGKAIASQLPDARVRDLLQRTGMERHSDNTITSIDAYMDELAKVRRLGYALDNGENAPDGRCIAAPLLGTHLPAAVSISAPAARFTLKAVEKAAKRLLDVADQLTTNPVTDQQLNETTV
ncbi:IclR family transcriptional regulator [Prauserella endophytica]|uniref:IclR family transcriptional regulator n=1 Tax=Prauserella endophytica TaxID=1592324 RepID=A0ABY2S1Z6_9PSEU|nr:IclR family transcriptional regulator [Prauserella endophytica]TKG66771.1 IclR family transcriptional regulator [Prauserella endophytica]